MKKRKLIKISQETAIELRKTDENRRNRGGRECNKE
jgi:hypothetical protein